MSQLPVYLQTSQAPNLVQISQQALGGINPPYLSIKGGKFTLVDQAGNEMPLPFFDPQLGVYVDCCIIDMNKHKSRIFYENDFDPTAQNYLPPECWSDNGTGPSASCSKPQASTCASCQWSVWGSATSAQGKPIPACQEVSKIALMIPGLGPQVENMIFLLRVPPASLKNYRAYTASFSGQGVNIPDVITRIYFDRAQLGVLLFQSAPAPQGMPLPYIGEGTYRLRESAYAEKKTALLVGHNDVARNPALPAAQAPLQIAAPQGQQNPLPAQAAASQTMPQTTVQGTTGFGAPSATSIRQTPTALPVGTAPNASPSNGTAPAPARRRRRTQAEIQAAAQNPAPQAQQPVQQTMSGFGQPTTQPPAQAPMAPFPVSPPAAPPAPPVQPNNFGMAEPVPANPQMQEMLRGLGFKPPGQQ